MNKFIEKIALAKLDGSFLKVLTRLDKYDLIILDDFGLQPLDANARLALLQILEDRYERKSMIIASQLPLDKWYDYIAEPTLADAIMDRLVSNATHIELKGESMRRRKKNNITFVTRPNRPPSGGILLRATAVPFTPPRSVSLQRYPHLYCLYIARLGKISNSNSGIVT